MIQNVVSMQHEPKNLFGKTRGIAKSTQKTELSRGGGKAR
jgi:hypothetical protein